MSAQAEDDLRALAEALADDPQALPPGVELLKRSLVRTVVRQGEIVLKVLHKRRRKARREARTLARARARGVPVPELVASGRGWVATRFIDARPAVRDDLDQILPVVRSMHARGMLHRDLHTGNILMTEEGPVLIDTQKARFLPHVPGWQRDRELGYLAHSLGDPLPEALRSVRFWREQRAQTHWRSRTARCVTESSGFTAFEFRGHPGFRRRDVSVDALTAALGGQHPGVLLKQTGRSDLYQTKDWIVKRHARARAARAAWIGGWGLEVRGIGVARPLAWAGPWIVMEDAGITLTDWVESQFEHASEAVRAELAHAASQLLVRLHRARVYHPDLKANNICWRPGRPPALIDYGHVRFGHEVSRRRRVKNLAQLNAALPDCVPASLREHALSDYVEQLGRADPLPALRDDVVSESLRRSHRWSGC